MKNPDYQKAYELLESCYHKKFLPADLFAFYIYLFEDNPAIDKKIVEKYKNINLNYYFYNIISVLLFLLLNFHIYINGIPKRISNFLKIYDLKYDYHGTYFMDFLCYLITESTEKWKENLLLFLVVLFNNSCCKCKKIDENFYHGFNDD